VEQFAVIDFAAAAATGAARLIHLYHLPACHMRVLKLQPARCFAAATMSHADSSLVTAAHVLMIELSMVCSQSTPAEVK
jgi:hypothetical protein